MSLCFKFITRNVSANLNNRWCKKKKIGCIPIRGAFKASAEHRLLYGIGLRVLVGIWDLWGFREEG